MGKNTDPPKCRTCGKVAWRHTCYTGGPRYVSSLPLRQISSSTIETTGMPIVTVEMLDRMVSKNDAPVIQGGKPSRKEYLRLKAIERRARQKAAKV